MTDDGDNSRRAEKAPETALAPLAPHEAAAPAPAAPELADVELGRPERSSTRTSRRYAEAEFRFSSGPLPSPESLAAYAAIDKKLVDRIVKMAEQQSAHRQGAEMMVVKGQTRNSTLGIVCGLAIGLAGLGAAVVAILHDHAAAGATIASFDMVGLVGVFVYGTRSRSQAARERTAHHMQEVAGRAAAADADDDEGSGPRARKNG